jgi:hypothetical protein
MRWRQGVPVSGAIAASGTPTVVHAVLGFEFGAEVQQGPGVHLHDGTLLLQDQLQLGERRILVRDPPEVLSADRRQLPHEVVVFLWVHRAPQ